MAEPGNIMIHSESIIFGEVLYDDIRDGSAVPGWALFNVDWFLQAFYQSRLFIFRFGNDPLGRKTIDAMISTLEGRNGSLPP